MQLQSLISENFRLVESQKKALNKLKIKTVGDLLYHLPVRYGDTAQFKNIQDLLVGESTVVYGQLGEIKTSKAFIKKIPMADSVVTDNTGHIKIIWFHQPYLAKMIHPGALVRLEGKVSERKGEKYLSNPKVEVVGKLPIGVGNSLFGDEGAENFLYPVYPESQGITSNWFYHAIQKVFRSGLLDEIIDPIPEEILQKYNLPNLTTAFVWIHSPKKEKDSVSARKRFAFQEVFFIQLEKQKARLDWKKNPAFVINDGKKDIEKFAAEHFPFTPTEAQWKAVDDILGDFSRGYAMNRLLEGDVGSGKTAVAAATAHAVISTPPKDRKYGRLQVAYMCPTEILAKQHFESFIKFFTHLNLQIGLITSSGCRKFPSKVSPHESTDISRSQLLKWVESGDIPILIGTHSLIQKTVQFKNLAYVIIDEQHRFGVNQRASLVRRNVAEDTLKNAEKKHPEEKVRGPLSDDTLLYKDLTYRIREAMFRVVKTLGLGHKELIYQRALEEEFLRCKLSFNREKQIPITYNKKKIGTYIPDFVVEDKVILELKSIPFIGDKEKKQTWSYLKNSDYKLALLANFGSSKLDIKRFVYDTARNVSASYPHNSAFLPHFLSMTATPIPRTLALTIYGDLDLTVVDQMPSGRKPIITEIVLPNKREETYEHIRKEIKAGRQCYVICPRIDEPDPMKESAVIAKSVTEETQRLKRDIFPEYNIAGLHGKMSADEKEEIMDEFEQGKIHILVATSVIEVGVNVPNSTMIVIEGAERFGLAQLHQLRGRVIRSNHQAYCFVFAEGKSAKTVQRLKAFKTAKNGFELAEYDLQLRGAGELSGGKQWGISDVGMEALKNIKMVEAARNEALAIITKDENLNNYPLLQEVIGHRKSKEIHFE